MPSAVRQPIGIYEKAFPAEFAWEERLATAAQAGFDFVEMSIDETDARLQRLLWPPAARAAVRQAVSNTGTPILTMGISGHRKYPLGSASAEVRARALDILCRSIELAADLGVRVIQVMGYDVFYESSDATTEARFLEGLFQGVRRAAAAGVMLALENVDTEVVNSVDKALRFVGAVDSPWLQVYPDIGNLVAAGYAPVEQLRRAQGHIVGVHVKDARPGEVRGVPFAEGVVPFVDVFQTLAGMQFAGPLTVELWAHLDPSGDPVGTATRAGSFVRGLARSAWDLWG